MDQDREERIKVRAHQLWEAESRPDGQHGEHWQRAEKEIDADGSTSDRAFADGADAPAGAGVASGMEAVSDAPPTTDDAQAMHQGRITPAG